VGATRRHDGRTKWSALAVAIADWQQSPPHDGLANAGPAGGLACDFLQQHLPWPWQQEELDSPAAPKAIGAREATESRRAMYAATALRAIRRL
jgi:hypothetical protein